MNATTSKDKKRIETGGDELLLPPKQTEWRRYSKTLIEELKEKLEDRRAKTLALLSENKDLSAFQEIDTESDGLDDTSTNATSKHDERHRSGMLELSSEQVLAVSSQSEASSLTDSDCCGAPHGYCASPADVAGGDAVCTHSSYSMTSSTTTDDEGQSKSLTPPQQDSVVTIASIGDENLPSIPYLDVSEEDIRLKCKSLCTHAQLTTAYMVRRSSSHCCLNTASPVVSQNFNVRLSRSFTYLGQEVDYELSCETTSSKFSCFHDVVHLVPTAPSCVPMKSHNSNSINVLRNEASDKELTDNEHEGSIKDKQTSREIKDGIGNAIIPGDDVIAACGESHFDESRLTANTGHVTPGYHENSAGIKRNAGMPRQDLYCKYGDSLSLSEKKCVTNATELLNRFEGRIDMEPNNKQCGDPEGQIKTTQQMDSRAESFNSSYIDRVTSELDYLQRKLMLEEICDVIKSSISGDVDRRLVLELKQKIDQCSVSLNVSGNSGYVTSEQQDSGGGRGQKEEPCAIPVTDSCSSQLKKCLEKAHLASLLQKEMGQAKSNIASLAAKRAYEKAIGDFDSIVNNYLKSDTPQDSLHDEQNKVDLVASFRRSETFIIDKDISLLHSPMSMQPTSSFLNSDTQAQNVTKSGKYNDISAGNVADDTQGASGGKFDDDMPPKSSPTFFVSQKTSGALGKRKRKKSDGRREKMSKLLTGNKMQDTNAFVLKHFGAGTRANSESDSTDSLSDNMEDDNPFTYTSSMLAQLLDYDSQDEKVTGTVEYLDLALKQNDHSSDNKIREERKQTAKSGQMLSKEAADFNADGENRTGGLNVENVDENFEDVEKLALEANVNYDSDFNAGSISECIQEEERSCDEDNDAGICFNTSDKKDVDSATFNVDRPMDSKDCSEMELNMNEETPAAKEVSTLPPEVYQYSEDFDLRDETNDAIEKINIVDITRCNEISLSIDKDAQEKGDIIKDISVTHMIPDTNEASDKKNYINKIDEIKDRTPLPVAKDSDKEGDTECITSAVVVPDVCQSATVGSSTNEVVSTCAGPSGSSCSRPEKPRFDQTSMKKLKKTVDKLEESNRSQFIPMVEWSSSEEDIFEDLTRDKSPSDILRQKQKESVDEKLKQLTQMSKRRRKSRSPVSYKTPQNKVSLETLLDGKTRKENQDAQVDSKNATNTSLGFIQKHLYAVLRSPMETQREPDCVQPSVSDLLLARLNGEDLNPPPEDKTKEQNDDTVLQTGEENGLNSCQISKPSTLKGSVSPSKVTRAQEPTMRFLGISSFTAQSPTKSTISSNQKGVIKEISSKTASTTDPASSVSSTSGEYNLPDNVGVPQKESRLKPRPDGLPPKCNDSPKTATVSSYTTEKHGVNCVSSSLQRTDKTGQCVRNAKKVDGELLPSEINPFFPRPGCVAKYVDNVVREVKIEQPATSQCRVVPLLTAVTEGGPSVMCAEEVAHEDHRQDQRDETVLKKLKDCLINDGSFNSQVHSFKSSAPSHLAAGVRSSYLLTYLDEDATRDFHCSEDEGYPLYPTPTSQPGSPYDNVIVDDVGAGVAQWDMGECGGHTKEGTTGDWMFVGDVSNFKQYLETARYLNIDSECVFKVINTGYDQTKNSSETPNGQTQAIGSQAQRGNFEKLTEKSATAPCHRETKEFKNQSCSSNAMESPNTNQETVLECHSGRNDILMSLLEKITLLESLVGQSQKSEASRNPQAHTLMDPMSFFLSGQQENLAGQPPRSRLSVNAPVICSCRLHDCTRNSFQGCCDHCGVCGRLSAPRCQGILKPEAPAPNVASKSSQTDAPDSVSKAASRTQSVSTQWQKQEIVCEGSGAVAKQTRHIGCQAELSQERCQCMQQCISSLENLEGIERKLHGEVFDLIKALKRDTEEMVSQGYDRVVSLLVAQLNEATSRSQQSVSSLITTFNQSLSQQLSDVTRCIGNLQCVKETSVDNKGQTTKPGMDYDTLKMRVVELTSQRDAEKVFHKITRESLRALERDHDRLRQEYVRATYRRLNHNSESEVRHRVYNLLNEPEDTYRCRHKHDKGHHSKYTMRGATEERVAKPCLREDEPRASRNSNRPLHASETCKELPKNRQDSLTELLASSEKTRSKSHRKDKKGAHSSKQRVALLDKDVLALFNKDATSGNNENCGQEIVQENSLCCMVDLKPTSRPAAEDINSISQKSSGHSRPFFENPTKTDGSKKYEMDIKEEHSSTGERRRSVKETAGLVKLPSTFSKDKDVFDKGHLFQESCEGYSWTKTNADPPATDSKCSLALSNESF